MTYIKKNNYVRNIFLNPSILLVAIKKSNEKNEKQNISWKIEIEICEFNLSFLKF